MASQYTHATELAARSARANLGVIAAYGDFVGAKDWLQLVWMAYLSFRITVMRLIELNCGNATETLARADHHAAGARGAFVASLQAAGDDTLPSD